MSGSSELKVHGLSVLGYKLPDRQGQELCGGERAFPVLGVEHGRRRPIEWRGSRSEAADRAPAWASVTAFCRASTIDAIREHRELLEAGRKSVQ